MDDPVQRERITQFCQKWKVEKLELFGSRARGDARPDSDFDLLVSFAPDSRITLLALAAMELELEKTLNAKVQILTRSGIEDSPNWVIKKSILESVRPLYAA